MAAKTTKAVAAQDSTPAPKPEAVAAVDSTPKPKYAETDNGIDARMWRLNQDHIRMGARPK